MGRKAMWVPRRVSIDDIINGAYIVRAYTAHKNTAVVQKYKTFCMVNGLSLEAGLEAWLGQMTSDGLSPGTVSTYLQTVMNLCPILHRSTEARRICAAAEAFHTHRGGRGMQLT